MDLDPPRTIRKSTGTYVRIMNYRALKGDCIGMWSKEDMAERRIGVENSTATQGISSAVENLEDMGEAFALIDRKFRLLDLNRAALEIDQRPRHELIGQPVWAITPGLEDSDFGEEMFVAPNGSRFWLLTAGLAGLR